MSSVSDIRIGTRSSALARYQAQLVYNKLKEKGVNSTIVEINSDGDADTVTPLYELGIQGIFTRTLDVALLEKRIDIAVHSAKDIPTVQAKGLQLAAVLERSTPFDCIVLPHENETDEIPADGVIATSSLRRKLQWLDRYPRYRIENLRGNIQTRLQKLDASSWQGAIFAQTALERLEIATHQFHTLTWMVPAPAQGAIGIMNRLDDAEITQICRAINHRETEICITAEREFLSRLHGGCAVPIAAHAQRKDEKLIFRANVMSLDAKRKIDFCLELDWNNAEDAGRLASEEALRLGVEPMIKSFRSL